MTMAEIRPIRRFPGYGISREGRVFRIEDTRQRKAPYELSQHHNRYGYLQVGLVLNGEQKKVVTHLLVLEAFCGPRPNGMEACHFNGVRDDNRAENLRWDTPSANQRDKYRHGTMPRGDSHVLSLLSKGDVEWIRAFPKRKGMFSEMARRLQVSKSAIRRAYRGDSWAHV